MLCAHVLFPRLSSQVSPGWPSAVVPRCVSAAPSLTVVSFCSLLQIPCCCLVFCREHMFKLFLGLCRIPTSCHSGETGTRTPQRHKNQHSFLLVCLIYISCVCFQHRCATRRPLSVYTCAVFAVCAYQHVEFDVFIIFVYVCVCVCHHNLHAQLHPDYPEALGAVAAGELADINLACCC